MAFRRNKKNYRSDKELIEGFRAREVAAERLVYEKADYKSIEIFVVRNRVYVNFFQTTRPRLRAHT